MISFQAYRDEVESLKAKLKEAVSRSVTSPPVRTNSSGHQERGTLLIYDLANCLII